MNNLTNLPASTPTFLLDVLDDVTIAKKTGFLLEEVEKLRSEKKQ